MARIDIAFCTNGDTRAPDTQPLVGRRSRQDPIEPSRIPHATISDVYRAYAGRLVGRRGRVFAVENSRGAERALAEWQTRATSDTVRNVYFIGHGNREFAWSVRVANGVVEAGDRRRRFNPPLDYFSGQSVRPLPGPDLDLVRQLRTSMGTGTERHVIEFRACFLEQYTVDNIAVALGIQQPGGLRVEVRGYRDFYAVVPNSNGGFRSEIISRTTDAVIASAPGIGAPRAQLFACLDAGQARLGAACP